MKMSLKIARSLMFKLAIVFFSSFIFWAIIRQYEGYLVDVALNSYSLLPLRVCLYFFILLLGGIVYYVFVPLEKLNLYVSVPLYVFTILVTLFIFGFVDASLSTRIAILYISTTLPIALWKPQKKLEPRSFTTFIMAFIIVALVSLLLRMWSPNLDYNYSECWMDMAIFTNSMRVTKLPLEDPWFSGSVMPYYYGGHYGFASLSLISLLHPDYAINVVSASILLLLFLASYGFSTQFLKNKKLALLIAVFITFGVNIYPFALFVEYLGKKFILGIEDHHLLYDSTRHFTPAYLIPGTTHHVPIVDFFQKELHANYMASPFIVTYLWLLHNLKDKELKTMFLAPYLGFFIPLFTWSWPVIALLTILALGILYGMISILASLLLYSPYLKTIISGAVLGLRIIHPTDTIPPKTPIYAILTILLPFVLIAYSYMGLASRSKAHLKLSAISLFAPLPLLLTRYAAMYFLTVILIYFALRKDEDKFLRAIIFVGLLTIIVCDFVYIDDLLGGIFERFNTVFKFYETAWMLLISSLPILIFRLEERIPKKSPYIGLWKACRTIFIAVLIISVAYVPLAAYAIKNPPLAWEGLDKDAFTLDGSGVLKPNDKAVIKILRKLPRGVLVEICGFDPQGRGYIIGYEYFARISSFSGNPTIIGWQNHEYVWRGINTLPEIINRSRDVMEFYKNPTRESLIYLKEKYNIRYIVVSYLENEFIISNTSYMSIEKWKSALLETGLVREVVNTTSYAIYEVVEGPS